MLDDIQEEWKPVVGYEGIYEVSSLGRIKRIKLSPGTHGGTLKPLLNSAQYYCVSLCHLGLARSFTIHSLVASSFLGLRPEGWHTNHKDGNKINNRVSNLEYCIPADNYIHAAELGLNQRIRLTAALVREIRLAYPALGTYAAIGRRFGIQENHAREIILRKSWKHVD